MKGFLSLFLFASVLLIACDKDKFQTKPTLSIKSINTELVPLNGKLVIELECTDKEGDVQDSLIIIKKRLNLRQVQTIRDTLRYKFPGFPLSTRIQIQATLDYQSILSAFSPPFIPGATPPQREQDTLILRLAVRDNAGNTSDTIETRPIYVHRQ